MGGVFKGEKLPSTVWVLTAIQSMAMSAGAMMVMAGGLLGADLAPSSELATLPVALLIIGTATGVVPVTRLMSRFGRKPVFIGISLFAMISSLTAAFAAQNASFTLFLVASFLLGMAVSGFQQVRFAAMESVPPLVAPKAASTVLLGGLVAAILGPELVTLGQNMFDNGYTGAFVLMAGLCLFCCMLFFAVTLKSHQTEHDSDVTPRAMKDIVRHPVFVVAVSSSVVGYALMSFIMTATPVHMHVIEHHSLEHTKWVIQSHIVAMFFPSFFSGWLISRLGVKNIIIAGIVVYLLTIFMALSGAALLNYWVALVLLGIGWNFLFLGGTVLLAKTHHADQKYKVQGLHDFMVFSAQAIAALGAGAMLYTLGWKGLLQSSLVIIVMHVLLLVWQANRQKRATSKSKLSEVTHDA